MLLVVRILLIAIDTAGLQSVDFNLLVISLVSFTLAVVTSTGIYKKWLYNYLEAFFHLQLGVFVIGVRFYGHNHGNIATVANASFGLALIVFLAALSNRFLFRISPSH